MVNTEAWKLELSSLDVGHGCFEGIEILFLIVKER
jgi:hypothetical protein